MKNPNIRRSLEKCVICPRACGADRLSGEKGLCGAADSVEVYAARLHFGEEPPISGTKGSGTVFFNHCSLRCVYCQNYRFSQLEGGTRLTVKELAGLMLSLERKEAHNINFVTPTHYAPQVAGAVIEARSKGLRIPIVYNTSGYEKPETLHSLKGLVDIYLTDMRYGRDEYALKYSSCPDYTKKSREAVEEMHRQVGTLRLSDAGLAEKGLIVRHLILPNDVACSEEVFRFIAERISRHTYISLMSQYYPAHRAGEYPELARKITRKEYDSAAQLLYKYGLTNGWVQEYAGTFVDSGFAGTHIEPGF